MKIVVLQRYPVNRALQKRAGWFYNVIVTCNRKVILVINTNVSALVKYLRIAVIIFYYLSRSPSGLPTMPSIKEVTNDNNRLNHKAAQLLAT